MKFVVRLIQERPYRSHFRSAEFVFTARDIDHAHMIVNDMIATLHLGNVMVVDLYRDDRAVAF